MVSELVVMLREDVSRGVVNVRRVAATDTWSVDVNVPLEPRIQLRTMGETLHSPIRRDDAAQLGR